MSTFRFLVDSTSEEKIKKSTYFRSLINQYTNLKLDTREFLCFFKEYKLIEKSINDETLIKFDFNNEKIEILPMEIETCPYNSEIYIVGINKNDNKVCIKSYRLCDINNIFKTDKKIYINNEQKIYGEIYDYMCNCKYFENITIEIEDN